MLSATRQRLIGVYGQLVGPLPEQQSFVNPTLQKQLVESCQASLAAIDKDRKAIDALIEGDDQLKELFALITSVSGIGAVTATEVVIATNELKNITNPDAGPPKKLTCYAGATLFDHKSGTNVRGRPGVSQHRTGGPARKRLKSLFHLAAMAATRAEGELQDYYQRKVKGGRNKMLVFNAVRNKFIHRLCAVVKRGEKYDKTCMPVLV